MCSMLRVPLISLLVHAKWFHIYSWNKWWFLCRFCPAWIQGMSEQGLGETSSPGVPECCDPCFGALWGTRRLLGSITSAGWTPFLCSTWNPRGQGAPPKSSLSTSSEHLPSLEKHLCSVPKLYHCSLNPHAETKPHTFKPPHWIFKRLYWTKKNTSLKSGDTTVPDGSKFTTLPPASYLLSFSNNTLAAWQLSRAV